MEGTSRRAVLFSHFFFLALHSGGCVAFLSAQGHTDAHVPCVYFLHSILFNTPRSAAAHVILTHLPTACVRCRSTSQPKYISTRSYAQRQQQASLSSTAHIAGRAQTHRLHGIRAIAALQHRRTLLCFFTSSAQEDQLLTLLRRLRVRWIRLRVAPCHLQRQSRCQRCVRSVAVI
jgi:hypothetical protein